MPGCRIFACRTPQRLLLSAVLAGASLGTVFAEAGGEEPYYRKPAYPPADEPIAMEMVPIVAGTFRLGSADGDSDEGPEQEVQVAAFRIDKTEVTVWQYTQCVSAKGCTPAGKGPNCNWGTQRLNHPINCVDWAQANSYCRWAGKRLPTEQEWEYAARGADHRTYPWGDPAPKDQVCWSGQGTPKKGTCRVGASRTGDGPFGTKDMSGNVWEWTASQYCPRYGIECSDTARVNRGGSWRNDDPVLLRTAARVRAEPADQCETLGFRCAQ